MKLKILCCAPHPSRGDLFFLRFSLPSPHEQTKKEDRRRRSAKRNLRKNLKTAFQRSKLKHKTDRFRVVFETTQVDKSHLEPKRLLIVTHSRSSYGFEKPFFLGRLSRLRNVFQQSQVHFVLPPQNGKLPGSFCTTEKRHKANCKYKNSREVNFCDFANVSKKVVVCEIRVWVIGS